jgi:hypothetical protein
MQGPYAPVFQQLGETLRQFAFTDTVRALKDKEFTVLLH